MKSFKDFLKEKNKDKLNEAPKNVKFISHSNVMKSLKKFELKYKNTIKALENAWLYH